MTKYFCDRCNNEIIGDIYRIKINTEPKNKSIWDEISSTVSSATATTNIKACFVEPPMYCQKCKEEFESFLRCDT